jgi:xanthine dehydrogenase accessory factor
MVTGKLNARRTSRAPSRSIVLELLDEILRRADAGERLAVCTVVRTRGSTPQKTGAVMVVLPDGQTLGTIGGGCVEAEVRTRALQQLESDANGSLFSFKLDHDLGWDDGLVCGGVMDVAVEVIDASASALPYRAARELLAAGREAAVTVTLPDESGTPQTFTRTLDPRPTLVIAGAGHVGGALADIAAQAGFDVAVIDDRPDFVTVERFPNVKQRIVGEIETELARYVITPHTYVVIVTRGHRRDGRALGAVCRSKARYVGLIGSKRKIVTIFQDLRRQGVPREQLERVRAPIGLDLGAVTPAEIAVSIAAELIAVRRRGQASSIDPMRLTPQQVDRAVHDVTPTDEPHG